MPSDDQHTKDLIKEAIKEWLDERYASFGKWTVFGISSALFIAFVKMVLASWWLGFWKH